MNPNHEPFEERLLHELRTVVAERPDPVAAATAPAAARRLRPSRPRLAIGGGATALAAAAAAIVGLAGGGGASPAYAIDRASDGSVVVTINRVEDTVELQRDLREAGVPTVVEATPAGKACDPDGRFLPVTPASPTTTAAGPADGPATRTPAVPADDATAPTDVRLTPAGAATLTIPSGGLGAGRTLVIDASRGESVKAVRSQVATGDVGPCRLVDASTATIPALTAPAAGGASHSVEGVPGTDAAGR